MKCQPLNFKGTEGVVELTQWFEKMETVFRISNCSVENQIKFSTCTPLGSTLTWWNSYVLTVGPNVTYAMTWVDLKKKITNKYCPRGEIKKLESKLWHLRVKSNDVKQSKPTATTEQEAEYRQGLHCEIGSTANFSTANNQRGNGTGQKPTCYECGDEGNFKKDCPKLQNNNRGTQGGNATAPAKVYAMGHGGTNLDSNVITGLAGYYRRFIEGFSKIAKSMTKLTQKGVKFDWGEKQEAAFQLLK
nr:reverse transcriptase domain-containing protein [Tanacetum cinerariifolium]